MLGDFLTGQAGRVAEPAQLQREPAAPYGGALLRGRRDLLLSGIALAISVAPVAAPPCRLARAGSRSRRGTPHLGISGSGLLSWLGPVRVRSSRRGPRISPVRSPHGCA